MPHSNALFLPSRTKTRHVRDIKFPLKKCCLIWQPKFKCFETETKSLKPDETIKGLGTKCVIHLIFFKLEKFCSIKQKSGEVLRLEIWASMPMEAYLPPYLPPPPPPPNDLILSSWAGTSWFASLNITTSSDAIFEAFSVKNETARPFAPARPEGKARREKQEDSDEVK